MYTADRAKKKGPLRALTIRISEATKRALESRAATRTTTTGKRINLRQVVRELLEHALVLTDEKNASKDELLDEVMASALFARRAFELVLSKHDGLAEKLLRASRAEVRRRKTGRGHGEKE